MNIQSSDYAKSKVFYQVEIVSNIYIFKSLSSKSQWLEKSCKFISIRVGRTFRSWIHKLFLLIILILIDRN